MIKTLSTYNFVSSSDDVDVHQERIISIRILKIQYLQYGLEPLSLFRVEDPDL